MNYRSYFPNPPSLAGAKDYVHLLKVEIKKAQESLRISTERQESFRRRYAGFRLRIDILEDEIQTLKSGSRVD